MEKREQGATPPESQVLNVKEPVGSISCTCKAINCSSTSWIAIPESGDSREISVSTGNGCTCNGNKYDKIYLSFDGTFPATDVKRISGEIEKTVENPSTGLMLVESVSRSMERSKDRIRAMVDDMLSFPW